MTTTSMRRQWETRGRPAAASIVSAQEIATPSDLREALPATPAVRDLVDETRRAIRRILTREDARMLVVVGPCSIHDAGSALAYARWLAEARARLAAEALIVMRVYLAKPRTRGGWKGFINDPHLDGSCDIDAGLHLGRRLMLEINAMGVPTATEFLDQVVPEYLGDLVSWAGIGARTVESQLHRELASGLSCPVGFKNAMSGDVGVAVNAVVAASRPQRFVGITATGRLAQVSTAGNPDCHVVLRGGAGPNHDRASIAAAAALLASEGLTTPIMVDCSHGNCAGEPRRQLAVADDLMRYRQDGGTDVCGLMVESHLIGGRQSFLPGVRPMPGLSITDACLGIDDTAQLLRGLADGLPAPGRQTGVA